MAVYIALIRKEEGTAFGVDFPDFPGCVTAGDTLEEARKAAAEILRFHVAGMIEDGEPVPPPSSLDQIMDDPHNQDAVAFLVDLPMERSHAVRVQITMDERLLAGIDSRAAALGKTRSGYLAELARGDLDLSEASKSAGRVVASRPSKRESFKKSAHSPKRGAKQRGRVADFG